MARGSSYAGVPPGPLSAYLGVRAANEQAGMQELQQAAGIQGLLSKMQAQQELDVIKRTVAEAGGDPAKASEALIKLGSPQALKLGIEMKALLPKPAEPFTLKPGEQRFPAGGGQPIASVPDKASTSPVAKLIGERDALPPNDPRRKAYDDAILKATTHPSPVQVNYPPSAGFGINPQTGKSGHYTIGKDGTLRWDDVQPIPSPADRKADQEATDNAATLDAIEKRTMAMVDLINKNYGVVGPAGTVRRLYETGVGTIPGMGNVPSPATDYKNETGLLLADVRKMVEKDPNLSNYERQNLLETMGAGTIQNPGSAIRALANVSEYVKRKKSAGAKPKTPQPPKLGEIKGGYQYIGGDPADPKSWKKQ